MNIAESKKAIEELFNVKLYRLHAVLTTEQKANWIERSESGEFTQIFGSMQVCKEDSRHGHCCLAVLSATQMGTLWIDVNRSIGGSGREPLTIPYINDYHEVDTEKRNYANVLPLIKLLPTID